MKEKQNLHPLIFHPSAFILTLLADEVLCVRDCSGQLISRFRGQKIRREEFPSPRG
jgi:hypothetical protein